MLLTLVLLAAAAEPNPFLSQAKVFQQSLEFERCLKRLEQGMKWNNSSAELTEIQLYTGLCKLGLGRERDAERHFETALKMDARLRLPPLQSPRIEEVFERVRTRLGITDAPVVEPAPAPEATPAPAPALKPKEPAAPVEAVIEPAPKPPGRARWVVGGVLAALALGSGGAGVGLGVTAQSTARQAREAMFGSDQAALGAQAQSFALGTNVAFAVCGVLAVAALISLFAIE